MLVRVQNVWTYFRRDEVVPFNLIKACSFRLSQDKYLRYRQPNVPIPPRMIYQPSRKRFLTGVLPVLAKKEFRFQYVDERRIPRCEIWEPPEFMLNERYKFQLDALDRIIRLSRGIVKFVVGGGKTYLAAGFAYRVRCTHLVITFKRVIFNQFVEFFKKHFDEEIGILGAGRSENLNARIVIANSGTLIKRDYKFFNRFDSVIVDEAHHIGWGSSIARVLRSIDAYFRVGLSGTPIRSGGDHLVTIGLLGPIVYNFDYRDGVEAEIIPRARVLMYRYPVGVGCWASFHKAEFDDIYNSLIVRNATRNEILCELVRDFVQRGKVVLVLVQRKLHGRLLERRLRDINPKLVFGDSVDRERLIEAFKSGECDCLIATDSLLSEGMSIHRIDTVVCAGGFKSPIATIQRVGRALRRNPGKKQVIVVDFFDESNKILKRQSTQRLKCYRKEGYEVEERFYKAGKRISANRVGG